jgi:hypothetical protein
MMSRMLDQIRNSQMPSNMMQFAARGALAVPPEETIEILVHIALHNRLFAEQARMTLAGWDERSSIRAAGDPNTSAEVLGYFVAPENLRPCLLHALATNESVSEDSLDPLAASGSRGVVEILLANRRVMSSRRLLEALQSNPALRPNEIAEISVKLAALNGTPIVEPHETEESALEANTPSPEIEAPDEIVESTVTKYLADNAAELEVEKDKPFQPIGLSHEEPAGEATVEAEAEDSEAAESGSTELVTANAEGVNPAPEPVKGSAKIAPGKTGATGMGAKAKKPGVPTLPDRRDSTLQKISRLDIKGRIALAMRGSKEERSILIRDSTKLVAIAVLESPKISDGEVEAFALQKNVLESVLRAIPMKRRFAKNYTIMRNLVFNPRTPLDLSLGLMKNLLVRDLKNLSGNKEVADTIRKVATRMFKQKMEKKEG